MSDNSDRDKVLAAFGGKKGLIDSGIPSIVFLIIFNAKHDLKTAIFSALISSIFLAIIRVIQRDTLLHAISGAFGVAVCGGIAWVTGNAGAFFISKLAINSLYGLAYLVGNIVKFPILGLVLGPILGENLHWRNDSARKSAYIKAGWVWVALFAIRLCVQIPIYLSGEVNKLGVISLLMGYPPYLLCAYITWLIIRKVPVTKPPTESGEH
jgi:intracellular septation protein A